jgi:hypothetical protein
MKHWLNTGIALKLSTLSADRSKVLKAILFAVLAVVLMWEATSRTVVAFLADVVPGQVLHIRSQQANALLNLAETAVRRLEDKSAPPASLTEIAGRARSLAEQALLTDPLNSRALRILGEIADVTKDEARAWRFMQAAARRSLNETFAVAWLMNKSAERQDYAAALYYADILLRTRPRPGKEIAVPVLARIAENTEAVAALKEMLSQNPPWRAQFLDALPNSVTDARTPLYLLLAVKQSSAPPTMAELRGYLNFLIARKFFALARYTWLQFLSSDELSEAGFVFNGGFQSAPSGLPFDWSITQGAGTTIDIDAIPDGDGNRALFVRFEDGRVNFGRVAQLIMLAPARYRLEAAYKGTLIGQRGLRWRVTCAEGTATPIGESDMIKGISSVWKTIEFSFTVPSSGCPAQYLHLDLDARMASEQFVSGAIWLDKVRISRVGDAAK